MDKKPAGRGVVDSIYALRLKRYNERGPGAKREPKTPTIEKLRADVAKVKPKAAKKKKRKAR